MLSRQLSVTRMVPSPSVWIAPPSSTNGCASYRSYPAFRQKEDATLSSFSQSAYNPSQIPPHALKHQNNPDVVADFRAKTEELFHSLDGQSADDIEKTVYAYVQSQIDEYGLDAQIVDVVVSGSRCRGIEQENSDLDVVVEYTGSTREDDLFNMLHEDSIYIAGIQVDINPITESRTGTLETYLPEVETYLQDKAQQEQINNQLVTQGRELVQEQNALVSEEKVLSELEKEPVIEPETVHITFTVAECGEFHNMGEYHEGIETIEEAMKLYNAIDPSRMHGIPSIGVNMHIEGTEEWEDEQADIVSGKRIDVDFLNYTPELRDTPKVQDALKKLIAAFPEKEVTDRETKEQKIQALAAELDKLSYEIDTYGYRDSVSDRESQIQMIADDIRTGNVKPLSIFLQASIDEGIDEDSERQAKELLVKLAEYKPLAKIELMLADKNPSDMDVLILGMGTGTYATQCRKYLGDMNVEGVEIDEKITQLSRKYFSLSEDVPVTTYDGRAYLNAMDKKYDVIMVDAYQDITIPFQMSSVEFFTLVKDHLNEDGVMVVNMNMRGSGDGNINQYLSDTIGQVFDEEYTVDVANTTNRELFASNNPSIMENLQANTKQITNADLRNMMETVYADSTPYGKGDYILTDDKAPVELLGMQVIDQLIEEEVAYYKGIYERDGIQGVLNSL